MLDQHLVLLATADKLHVAGRVFDFFGKIFTRSAYVIAMYPGYVLQGG
jgi:hypothetical protein